MIAVAWAALDVREVVHQFDESRSGIAVLHLTAAALAGVLAARAPADPTRCPGWESNPH